MKLPLFSYLYIPLNREIGYENKIFLKKKMLTLTFSQLKQIYNQEIPEVVEMADKSSSVEEFKPKNATISGDLQNGE